MLSHTLPQDDFADADDCIFWVDSLDNSSASPQEQSLQAIRFPVVPQTKNHLVFFYSRRNEYIFKKPFKFVALGLSLSFSSSNSSSLIKSSSSDNFQTAAAAVLLTFLVNDNFAAEPTSYEGFSPTITTSHMIIIKVFQKKLIV